jgi:hypothetical protein
MMSNKLTTTAVDALGVLRHYSAVLRRRAVPPPVAMAEMIVEAWSAQAISAAAQLGIADALVDGPLPIDELAERVRADPDALRRLLRALISRGIFRRRGDGTYQLTPLASTLRSDADISLGAFASFLGSPQVREHWSHLDAAIRTGRPVVPALRGQPTFDYFASDSALAQLFNDAMTSVSELATGSVVAAYDFSRYRTIVDVGGGHGRFLSAILAATPLASGVLFDQPDVVAGASTVLARCEVQHRVTVEAGSFFDEIPSGGEAYVLKRVIHDWPEVEARRILSNVRTAAGPGGTVLLVEWVIGTNDRESVGKWADLEMMIDFGSRERTAEEYRALLATAGLRTTRVVPTSSPFSIVEAVAT